MKKILSTLVILPVLLVVSCFASPSENDNTTQEVVVLGAVAVAMSKSATPIGSCNLAGVACQDYYPGWTSAQMQSDCTTGGGTFNGANTSCSTSNRVGSCTVVSTAQKIVRFYSPTFTLSLAQSNCSSTYNGVFTAN